MLLNRHYVQNLQLLAVLKLQLTINNHNHSQLSCTTCPLIGEYFEHHGYVQVKGGCVRAWAVH